MNYTERFLDLTALLASYRPLWQQSHFIQLTQPWQQQFPALCNALLALNDQETDYFYQGEDGALSLVARYIPALKRLPALTTFAHHTGRATLPVRLALDVPGRKWQQVEAFVSAVSTQQMFAHTATTQVVDWCAGKSHLGRALAFYAGKSLRAIERDSVLCEAGAALSQRWLETVTFTPIDVLSEPVQFAGFEQVVALHACGDLHRKLIVDWQQSESAALVLAPCCYHKWFTTDYQPLSQLAMQHDLVLQKDQVQLAVQEWVTVSAREKRQNEQMMQCRLAFDALQRQITGVDSYMTTPSLPYGMLAAGEMAVLQHLCERKNIVPPASTDWNHYIALGKDTFRTYRRLQLVNHSFKRAIESWLVLDMAISLQEQGCQVELTTFCERSLSPRNLMVLACKQS